MELLTRDYGTVEIDESTIIRFDDGIIGFEGYHDYALLDVDDKASPFRYLQSVDDSGLAFILLDPFCVRADYEISIDDEAAARLSANSGDNNVSDVASSGGSDSIDGTNSGSGCINDTSVCGDNINNKVIGCDSINDTIIGSDVVVLVITVVPDDVRKTSVNLKAPVIINASTHRGIQYISDNVEYGVRHYLADEAERTKNMHMHEDQAAV